MKKDTVCSFCGRNRKEVGILIAGVTGHICDSCITQAHAIIQEEEQNTTSTTTGSSVNVLKPKEILNHLNEYIIGQMDARKYFLLLFTIILKD